MIAVHLTKTFQVTDCADLDANTDAVMEALVDLESETLRDADVAATLADGIVEISILAFADDFDTAAEMADSAIRTAIHAAHGATPDWETCASSADREELVAA